MIIFLPSKQTVDAAMIIAVLSVAVNKIFQRLQ